MGEQTGIEWCHHTWNPWRGCTKVSPGCDHCYAEVMSHRNPAVLGEWGDDGNRVIGKEAYWQLPMKWNKSARTAGERRRVFCASLGDVFEDRPDLVEPRERVWDLIATTWNLDFLLLTKRPENIERMLPFALTKVVWLGASVEDRKHGLPRLGHLRRTSAAVRFLSVEPLLEDLGEIDLTGIDWVIVGGESGHGARPMDSDWARSVRDQCGAAAVPFFMKQMSKKATIPDDLMIREFPVMAGV